MERGDAKVNAVRAVNDVDKKRQYNQGKYRTRTRGSSLKSMHSSYHG
jgi:hypothetical protein